jgi:hypothetical protein
MNFLIALIIGLMAGAHSSTWGMYKDAPYEGFTYRKYFRSIILSGLLAILIWMITQLDVSKAYNIFILFGFTYGIERAILEFYKTFLRSEDQSKYFIPMQFHVQGKIVDNKNKRLLIGGAYLIGVLMVFGFVYYLDRSSMNLPWWVVVFFIGTAGGWISAFGGAWKDAPIEGFELFKFFRSPVITAWYALLLSLFTENYLFIAVGALGYTVATIETYKTFFFPTKPRGKFSGKEIKYPEMLIQRQRFVPLYVSIWIAIIITFMIALSQPFQGLIVSGVL